MVQRVDQATGRVSHRRSTICKRLFGHSRGFVCVQDGSAFASQLARYLADRTSSSAPPGPPEAVAPSWRSLAAGGSVERIVDGFVSA